MQLITGGLGFIGNELARQLARDQNVIILDNGHRIAPCVEDLGDIPVHDADITDRAAIARVFREVRPRVVFHLAAIHYIPECNADPERTLRVNVEGTLAVLNACTAEGVEHLIFASTGAVYADAPEPLKESSPVEPVDIYGWSKWFAESLCRWHSYHTGLPVTVCRLFNCFGPRETNRHIIPEIIAQLRVGDELRLGNTSARRDYVHTDDVAKALIAIAAHVPRVVRTINVSSGMNATVDELVSILSGLLNRKLRVTSDLTRFRKVDKEVQVADVAFLRQLLGWTPQTGLRDGLADLLRFEGLLK